MGRFRTDRVDAGRFADIEERADIWMIQRRNGSRLLLEPFTASD